MDVNMKTQTNGEKDRKESRDEASLDPKSMIKSIATFSNIWTRAPDRATVDAFIIIIIIVVGTPPATASAWMTESIIKGAQIKVNGANAATIAFFGSFFDIIH